MGREFVNDGRPVGRETSRGWKKELVLGQDARGIETGHPTKIRCRCRYLERRLVVVCRLLHLYRRLTLIGGVHSVTLCK